MQPDPIEITQLTYNQVAGQYAAINAVAPQAVTERAARLAASLPPGARLLDLGCGPGRDLAWFAAHGVHACGADLSSGMLAEARRAAACPLCQMDMRRTGFAARSFAGVWCNAALLHLPKQAVPQVLAEIARILIPGGSFFMAVKKGSGEGLESAAQFGSAQRFFARYQALEMADLLEGAGFRILRMDESQSGNAWLNFETQLPPAPGAQAESSQP